jgi:hypothetical protein
LSQVFNAIFDKTKKKEPKISKTTVYHRIEAYHKKNKILFSQDAYFFYAHQVMRINVDKLQKLGLDSRGLARLYDFLNRSPTVVSLLQEVTKEVKTPRIQKKLVAGFGLPPTLIKDANKMADVYPDLYQVENLVRYVIMSVLEKKHGSNWWDNHNVVSKKIADSAETRKTFERENRWVAKRGTHSIFYTDFSDLARIINLNINDFKLVFGNMEIEAELRKLEPFRNIVAHNNPLPPKDIVRIKTALDDLQKQLEEYSKQKNP